MWGWFWCLIRLTMSLNFSVLIKSFNLGLPLRMQTTPDFGLNTLAQALVRM
jgi:hypothetical protein